MYKIIVLKKLKRETQHLNFPFPGISAGPLNHFTKVFKDQPAILSFSEGC
jgi:hypothetical protein